MVAKQKIHVGMIHASKTVTVNADSDRFTVTDGGETIAVVPRTIAREISRYKAYATQRSRSGEQHFGPRRCVTATPTVYLLYELTCGRRRPPDKGVMR